MYVLSKYYKSPPISQEHIQTMIIPRNPILAIGVLIVDVELYLLSFTAAPYNQELHIKVC